MPASPTQRVTVTPTLQTRPGLLSPLQPWTQDSECELERGPSLSLDMGSPVMSPSRSKCK